MTNSFDRMIREAKAYRKAHPKDKYWKYHFKLSKGVKEEPPLDYPKKLKRKLKQRLKQQTVKVESTKDRHMKKVSRRI